MRTVNLKIAVALVVTSLLIPQFVSAQLQPLIFTPIETHKEVVNCSTKDCHISSEQYLALVEAVRLYKIDMPKVKKVSMSIGVKDNQIEVTVFPDTGDEIPKFSIPGGNMAITYLFDSLGSHLIKKIFNR